MNYILFDPAIAFTVLPFTIGMTCDDLTWTYSVRRIVSALPVTIPTYLGNNGISLPFSV